MLRLSHRGGEETFWKIKNERIETIAQEIYEYLVSEESLRNTTYEIYKKIGADSIRFHNENDSAIWDALVRKIK